MLKSPENTTFLGLFLFWNFCFDLYLFDEVYSHVFHIIRFETQLPVMVQVFPIRYLFFLTVTHFLKLLQKNTGTPKYSSVCRYLHLNLMTWRSIFCAVLPQQQRHGDTHQRPHAHLQRRMPQQLFEIVLRVSLPADEGAQLIECLGVLAGL